jgi:hypothetical protein
MSAEMGTRRVAGQYVRERARSYESFELWIGGAAVAVLLLGWALGVPSSVLIAFEVGAIVIFLISAPVVDRESGRWSRGAEGEEVVGRILEGLSPAGWHVLHDVSFGRGNIDHVVVGPGGVFSVETKSHPGRRSVDRLDPKMLAQAYAEKKTLETVIEIEVQPLLVFSRAYLIESMPAKRQGVTILPARMLDGFFARRRPMLSAEQAAGVHRRLAQAAGQATETV